MPGETAEAVGQAHAGERDHGRDSAAGDARLCNLVLVELDQVEDYQFNLRPGLATDMGEDIINADPIGQLHFSYVLGNFTSDTLSSLSMDAGGFEIGNLEEKSDEG